MLKKDFITIRRILRNIQTDEVQFELEATYRGKTVVKTISRGSLTVRGLSDLRGSGFPFLSNDAAAEFIENALKHEYSLPLLNVFTQVGWHEINNKRYYLHRNAIHNGKAQKVFYDGMMDLSAKGTFDDFKEFFNSVIADSIGLQTVCAVSLSAAIVGLLKSRNLSFILHIEGGSTTGKTTSLQLAGSLWGNPTISNNGIVRTWNATDNGLVNSSCGNCGLPICLDELIMTNADKTGLTYLLTGGSDKQRMSADSADEIFRTVFMSTGEISFKSSNYGGVAARLFEVKDYNFTRDKETADRIVEFFSSNYGVAGFEFVKKLSMYTSEWIENKLATYTEKVLKRVKAYLENKNLKYNPIIGRNAEKIAIVALAAQIGKKQLGLNFNVSKVVNFFIEETTLLDVCQNEAFEATEKFLSYYSKHQSKFPQKGISHPRGDVWGASIFRNSELCEIVVLYDEFIRISTNLGYHDIKSLINSMKAEKLIICEPDKNYNRRKVGNIKRAKVIVINVSAFNAAIGGADK